MVRAGYATGSRRADLQQAGSREGVEQAAHAYKSCARLDYVGRHTELHVGRPFRARLNARRAPHGTVKARLHRPQWRRAKSLLRSLLQIVRRHYGLELDLGVQLHEERLGDHRQLNQRNDGLLAFGLQRGSSVFTLHRPASRAPRWAPPPRTSRAERGQLSVLIRKLRVPGGG